MIQVTCCDGRIFYYWSMKHSLSLGSVGGIKISIHWTFIFLILWIIYINISDGHGVVTVLWSLLFISSIFGVVVLHELGHALMARRFEVSTRDITLYPIGGVARLDRIPKEPKAELLIALAGPFVNLVIALMLYPLVNWTLLAEPERLAVIDSHNFLLVFTVVNIWLALFNLIPAFPMDGGRVLRALLSFRFPRVSATRVAAGLGQLLALGFILIGFYTNPFLIFIGLFILLGAQSEYGVAKTEELLEGTMLKDLMMRKFQTLTLDSTIQEAVDELLNSQAKFFIVRDQRGQFVGVLNHTSLIKSLRTHDEATVVGEILDKDLLILPSTLSTEEGLQRMRSSGKSVAIVREGDQDIGVVDQDNLVEFVMVKAAKRDFSRSLM